MPRYTIDASTWSTEAIEYALKWESATLVDTRNGNRYRDGAHRVLRAGKILKTFRGETAWSDAQRLFHDEILKDRYARS